MMTTIGQCHCSPSVPLVSHYLSVSHLADVFVDLSATCQSCPNQNNLLIYQVFPVNEKLLSSVLSFAMFCSQAEHDVCICSKIYFQLFK